MYIDYSKIGFNEKRYIERDIQCNKAVKRLMHAKLGIVKVIVNDPAVIVLWDDGTKTVVKCQEGDIFDAEKGLAMAIIKHEVGNNHAYYNDIFKKWLPETETKKPTPTETKKPTPTEPDDIYWIKARRINK